MPAPLPVIVDSRGADERRASPAPLQALQRGDAVSSWLLTGGSVNVGMWVPGVFHTQFWVLAASRTGQIPHSIQVCWRRALLPPRAQLLDIYRRESSINKHIKIFSTLYFFFFQLRWVLAVACGILPCMPGPLSTCGAWAELPHCM